MQSWIKTIIREYGWLPASLGFILLLVYLTYDNDRFVVRGVPRNLEQPVIELVETYRDGLARQWFCETQNWTCTINIEIGDEIPDRGLTTFPSKMEVHGSSEQVFLNILPHEVMHMVTAHHYGGAVPRWADEGLAMQVEMLPHLRVVYDPYSFKDLFSMENYPWTIMRMNDFYTQSELIVSWLVELKGRKIFIMFLEDVIKADYNIEMIENRMEQYYGFTSLDEAQRVWTAWAKEKALLP